MKITKEQLKKIIQEELEAALAEGHGGMTKGIMNRISNPRPGTMDTGAKARSHTLKALYNRFFNIGIRTPDPYKWHTIPNDIQLELEELAKSDEELAAAIAHAKERSGKKTID